jgi:hypothetical protein
VITIGASTRQCRGCGRRPERMPARAELSADSSDVRSGSLLPRTNVTVALWCHCDDSFLAFTFANQPDAVQIGDRETQETHSSPMEHFRAGDKAAFSGVYKAVHDKDHIPAHYVTALYGEIFPS